MIVGICGGSGSGKTTLLKRLFNEFEHLNPSVFTMDNYYKPIDEQVKDQKGTYNFDLPTALDEELLVNDLRKLVAGHAIEVREYHFNAPPDKNVWISIKPSKLIKSSVQLNNWINHYKKCIVQKFTHRPRS